MKSLLELELDNPCVATVQALVIMSHHEIGNGKDTRGWLFSGEFPIFLFPKSLVLTNKSGKEWQCDSLLTLLCISTCLSMSLQGTSPLPAQSFVERCFGLHILLTSKFYIRAHA